MAYYFDWSVSWDDEEGFGGAGETKIFSPKDFDKAQKLQTFLKKVEKSSAAAVRGLIAQNFCPEDFKQELLSLLRDLDKGHRVEVGPLRFTKNIQTLYV
jgi:hypothetical protein